MASVFLEPSDLIYVSYPRKRDQLNTQSDIHDSDWDERERKQQQVHRRRVDPEGNHYIDLTPQVRKLTKTGKRLGIEFKSGETAVCDEFGESGPGMLIGKVREP